MKLLTDLINVLTMKLEFLKMKRAYQILKMPEKEYTGIFREGKKNLPNY